MSQEPEIIGNNRNPDGTFKEGFSGNPAGRPPGTGGLKDYDRRKFQNMSDEEKEEFLQKISPELRYRMAEGNPQNDLTTAGEKLPTPLLDAIRNNNSHKEDSEAE